MKILKIKWIVGLMLMLVVNTSFGQVDRILQAMDDGNMRRALKLAEDAAEEPETRRNPEVYFLQATVLYELMKDEYYLKKNPEAFEQGWKALERGIDKDEDSSVAPNYSKLIKQYVEINNELGKDQFGINKFSKAQRTFRDSYDLNGDTSAFFWEGKCALYNKDTTFGEERYGKVFYMYTESFAETGSKTNIEVDPFLYFADKYWRKQSYDTASFYLDQARKIFGGTPKIDYYQSEIAKQQIKELPPSTMMMERIEKYLGYFPKDTFLIRKQNALYLYQIRGALRANDDSLALQIMTTMGQEKIARSEGKDKDFYEKEDYFSGSKVENVWWKIANYFFANNHDEAGKFVSRQYIRYTAESEENQAILDRWLVIIDYAAKKKSLSFASNLLQMAVSDYPKSQELAQLRTSLIDQFGDQELGTADLGALNALLEQETKVKKDADLKKKYNEVTSLYIDKLIQDKHYAKAKNVIDKYQSLTPKDPIWERKYDYLAKEDFFHSYYKTRIVEEEVAGILVPGFEWNGDVRDCEPGKPELSVQQKVEDRVNYFRRNAGVPEIYLDPELNEWCQEAALIMESNQKMSHELTTSWRCYTDEGAYAAKYSLLTEGATTTMAVTSFFADNNNPTVGHRRWLLYPNSKALGHGSTEKYCALWALDDSGSVDTNLYKEQFVSWPPEGRTPKMMIFRYWSFSLDQNLEGAKVEMYEGDKAIPLVLQERVEGYGYPTLVWDPQIDAKSFTEDHVFKVVVKLKNGRVYTYMVQVMDFDPVGY